MSFFRRLWFFLTRRRRMDDLDDEMRLHMELRAAANRERGLTPAAAAREARRRFGNPLTLREAGRDTWGFIEPERIARDLRDAVRQLIRRPATTLVIVVTLALGVGANASVFTLVDAMLFRPTPWDRTGRLIWMSSVPDHVGAMSYADYEVYRDHATTISGLTAFSGNGVSVGGPDPALVNAGLVSANYFSVLGIHAAIGRTFTPDEAASDTHAVVVLSDAFWWVRFAADPDVVGRVVAINGRPFTIIGVAQRGFTGVAFADNAEELWMPLSMTPLVMPGRSDLLEADTGWLRIIGRLRDGATMAQADAEMKVIAGQLNPPGTPRDRLKSARVTALRGGMTPWEKDSFASVFGLVSIVPLLVLLVACANVANVLMARDLSRRKEFALRRAIGASRARLIRQLLTESLLMALLAAGAGFAISFGLTALITHYGGVPSEFAALLTPDVRSLAAATVVAVVTIVFFGLLPALTATRIDVLPALKDEGTATTGGGRRSRLQRVLVIAQVALSLSLMIVASLFLQSLSNALRVDPGFDPHGVVTVSFDAGVQRYTPVQRRVLTRALLEGAAAIPGAVSAATTNIVPLSGVMNAPPVVSETDIPPVHAAWASISPRYFETLRLPLVRGRDFSETDAADAPPVAIVNQTLAKRLWPHADPIGQRIRVSDAPDAPWQVVIGIVADARYLFLTEPQRPAFYTPAGQLPDAQGSLLVRTSGDTRTVLASLRELARRLDPDLPLFDVRTLDESIRRTLNLKRAVASLLSILGGITLLLAAVGIYGVAAHTASRRTREVGIRMSLGARATDVSRLFIREGLSLSLIGVSIGLAISAAASTLVTAFLFGLTATDPATFIGGAMVMCLVTVAATYLPARRAARVEPVAALRHE